MLKVNHITVLANKGYYNGKDNFECEQNDISCLDKKPKSGEFKKREIFYKYDKNSDVCICSNKNTFRFMRNQQRSNGKQH